MVEELISLENGAPVLLYSQKERGRVMVLSTTIDRDWTDLPIQPDFVPFVQGVIRFLSNISMNPTYILPHGVPLKLANNGDQDTSYQLNYPMDSVKKLKLEKATNGGIESQNSMRRVIIG